MDNKIIIFGSGKIGHEVLDFLGDENILCFCDNNLQIAGTERYGKSVISFDELKQKYSDSIIIIAVGEVDSFSIAKQCEENGVLDYSFYKFLRSAHPEWSSTEFMDFIGNPLNRANARKDVYCKKLNEVQMQVEYFKTHADIRHMKPAQGGLRAMQLENIEVAIELFNKIDKLEIKPILYGGNLIGYLRHGGYIPWDDDVDFALFRDDYEKLKDYCRRHMYTADDYGNKEKAARNNKDIESEMEIYHWSNSNDHFCIAKHFDDGHGVSVDFFPLEYYAEGYSFDELIKCINNLKSEIMVLDSKEEKIKCTEEALRKNKHNTARESSNIYFGIDAMANYCSHDIYAYIPREVVFPLKKILYEGEYFWIPNKPEEFIKYEYSNIWEFPYDVGISSHYGLSD